MIKIEGMYKSFGDLEVLKGIDLEVQEGETVAIIGPSGSGKSTMLRCLNLLETPQKGKVTIGSHQYDSEHLDKKKFLEIRRATAMVFQNYCLFENKTALKNITLPLVKVKKMSKDEAEKIGLELLERVGLLDRKDYYPSQLSGGQQQRVGIARALALNPDVILFDEPTSALDPELVQGVLDVIRQISEEKITTLVVTHEMAFARDVADRVVFMDGGEVVEQGDAVQVITNPQEKRTQQFLQRFLNN
jgi:ABC-type polar amino acid transport system ATPase subunit